MISLLLYLRFLLFPHSLAPPAVILPTPFATCHFTPTPMQKAFPWHRCWCWLGSFNFCVHEGALAPFSCLKFKWPPSPNLEIFELNICTATYSPRLAQKSMTLDIELQSLHDM